MAIAPEGKSILLITALIAILGVTAGILGRSNWSSGLCLLSLLPLAFSLYFFRDPLRRPPTGMGLVVAPADGRIIEIQNTAAGTEYPAPAIKISIFMSPLNVHVNRIPVGGTISDLRYQPGKFSAAFETKASLHNERQYLGIDTPYGLVGCVQVAGWLARRIVCHLRVGQAVVSGERFGLIRFGSRLDLFLPLHCEIKVVLGQKTRAGETIIGVFHEKTQ